MIVRAVGGCCLVTKMMRRTVGHAILLICKILCDHAHTQILMRTFEQARCTSHSLFPLGLLAALGIQRDR